MKSHIVINRDGHEEQKFVSSWELIRQQSIEKAAKKMMKQVAHIARISHLKL